MTHYPGAELALWKYRDDAGNVAYFRGINKPIAVVLHIAQGYASTARAWAAQGHYGASWHYFVCLDGTVLQQLEHEDGGYHAGIASPPAPTPTWPLWKGSHLNINCYTIGIEHEGFSGNGFSEAQRIASRDLCKWLAGELSIPYDRDHFPPHADIDLINRPSDFAPPEGREAHYQFMFEEEGMTPEETARMERLERLVAGNGYQIGNDRVFGEDALKAADTDGGSLFLGLGLLQKDHYEHLADHPGATTVSDHKHTPGGVAN